MCVLGGCDRQPGEIELSAADRELIRENILPKAPNMALPVNADLDGKIIYLGCDIDKQQVSPGESFTVIHYWKVLDPPGPDWKLFTHLGPKTVNVDRTPIKGKYPVSEWKVGEIIRDEQVVMVPMRWNSPFIIVYVGIFHLRTRIEVRSGETDGANRIVAVRMPVWGTPREAAVPELEARRAWRSPVVDGQLDDPAWAEAPARPMVNADTGGSVFPITEVKLLWDDDFLFVGVHTADFKRSSNNTLRVLLAARWRRPRHRSCGFGQRPDRGQPAAAAFERATGRRGCQNVAAGWQGRSGRGRRRRPRAKPSSPNESATAGKPGTTRPAPGTKGSWRVGMDGRDCGSLECVPGWGPAARGAAAPAGKLLAARTARKRLRRSVGLVTHPRRDCHRVASVRRAQPGRRRGGFTRLTHPTPIRAAARFPWGNARADFRLEMSPP